MGNSEDQRCVTQPGECEWMLRSDVTKQVKWCCLHYFRRWKLVNAMWKASGADRSLAFQRRWRMCFSIFRTTCSRSFVLMQTFSLLILLTDKTRTAIKEIYFLISVHALWMAIFLSVYFSQQQQTMMVTWSCSNVPLCHKLFLPVQKTVYTQLIYCRRKKNNKKWWYQLVIFVYWM